MSDAIRTKIEDIFKTFPWRGVIALLVIVMSFAYLFMLMSHEIPEGNRSIVNVAAGLLLGLDGAIIQYYFGASKDSSDAVKADAVKALVNGDDKTNV